MNDAATSGFTDPQAMFAEWLALDAAGEHQRAEAMVDEALRRLTAEGPAGPEQTFAAVQALFLKGRSLRQQRRAEDAIACWDELLADFGSVSDLRVRVLVLRSLNGKAQLLEQLNRLEEDLQILDDALRRFGDAEERELRELVALALFRKGSALRRMGRLDDAFAVFTDVGVRFRDAAPVDEPLVVARAEYRAGLCLYDLGRLEETIDASHAFCREFQDSSSSAVRGLVAGSMLRESFALRALKRDEQEGALLARLVKTFRADTAEDARLSVAGAMVNLGEVLERTGHPEEALKIWKDTISRFGVDPPRRNPLVAERALVFRVRLLASLGRDAEALADGNALLGRLDHEPGSPDALQVAGWVLETGEILIADGDADLALRLATGVRDRLATINTATAATVRARAQLSVVYALSHLARHDEAMAAAQELLAIGEPAVAVLDDIVTEAQAADDPNQELIARSLFMRALVISQTRGARDGRRELKNYIRRFSKTQSPTIQQSVRAARERRNELGST